MARTKKKKQKLLHVFNVLKKADIVSRPSYQRLHFEEDKN